MHIGLTMECDYREGRTQEEAFAEAFETAEIAEGLGYDGVWLAERHFAPPGGAGIPSVVSSPLVFASALAARTKKLRIGTGVLVLPLGHPVRMAEEVATIDHISQGRIDLGIGRSAFPRSYDGYNLPYADSRERFEEYLTVMKKAWTEERFSHQGKYYTFKDVCLIPKPMQKPHPPLRAGLSSAESFPILGRLGLPIFVGLRGMTQPEVKAALVDYHASWKEAGHPGKGDVMVRVPVYVGETMEEAMTVPRASVMHSYARLGAALGNTANAPGVSEAAQRAERARRLGNITFEDLLNERIVFGTPETVTQRLNELKKDLGLSGIIIEPNSGGKVAKEDVFRSIKLFATEVAPMLRN